MTSIATGFEYTIGKAFELVGQKNPFSDFAAAARSEMGKAADDIVGRVDGIAKAYGEEGALGELANFVLTGKDLLNQHVDNTIEAEDKILQGKTRAREEDKKQKKEMDEWEKAIAKGNLAFTGKVLENMATLMQTSNRELFYIGKASALANAIINTAQGVSKAIGEYSYPYNIFAAAAVGVAGGVQIATIAGTNPSFAQGGIVPGTSTSGDRVTANVNSREAILTLEQQQNLFNAISSGNIGGGGGVNVYIDGNVIADSPSRIQELAERISDEVRFGNATLYASGMA